MSDSSSARPVSGNLSRGVDKEGFQQTVNPGVELHVGDAIALNLTLQVGSAAQSVTSKRERHW